MGIYYEVRGPRAAYVNRNGELVRAGVTPSSHLRFSCLHQADAEAFATQAYRRESIVCTIDEVTR